jgi:hypothetical protein
MHASPLGMKTVLEFFGIQETDFEMFIEFTGNGIFRKRNRFSEFSIGIGVVFYRPFPSITGFVENYRICVSEFSRIVSRNFFRNFPACDFFASLVRLWIRITYFCIFWTF